MPTFQSFYSYRMGPGKPVKGTPRRNAAHGAAEEPTAGFRGDELQHDRRTYINTHSSWHKQSTFLFLFNRIEKMSAL